MQGIQQLHRALFFYSLTMILFSVLSVIQSNILFLIFSILPSFAYWVIAYCLSSGYKFPGSIPNLITSVRYCLLLLVSAFHASFSIRSLGILLGCICCMDILDGLLARKLNQTSLLGEYLDKETDALFVLILSVLIYIRIIPSFWVLIPGLIRYIYFTSIYMFMPSGEKEHKDPLARILAVFLFIGIVGVFILPITFGKPLYIAATTGIIYSFLRSTVIQFGMLKI